jgi:HSP20 family protein
MNTILTRRSRNDFPTVFDMFDRLFDSAWPVTAATHENASMPMDIFEKDNKVSFRASLPGVKPEEIEVSVDDNVLTIRGELKHEWATDEATKVYRREVRHGLFTRSIRLPEGLDLENIDAEFENGLVTVSIPKVEPLKTEPRRIPVRPATPAIEASA